MTDLDDRGRELKRLSNALATDAPMTREELGTLQRHFAELARLMLVSGMQFAAMRHLAQDMHNRAVDRLNGVERPAIRRRVMHGLMFCTSHLDRLGNRPLNAPCCHPGGEEDSRRNCGLSLAKFRNVMLLARRG